MKDLMATITRVAHEHDATRVVRVALRIGALAHISADHLRAHFEQAARGGVAEGAVLEIETYTDIHDPRAQDILLAAIDVDTDTNEGRH